MLISVFFFHLPTCNWKWINIEHWELFAFSRCLFDIERSGAWLAIISFPALSRHGRQLIEDIERGGTFCPWRIAWFQINLQLTPASLVIWTPPEDGIGNHAVPLYYTARGVVFGFLKPLPNANFLVPLMPWQEPIVRSGQVHTVIASDSSLKGYCTLAVLLFLIFLILSH